MKSPLVSIIIPTYNREIIINKALDSVLGQTYTQWECLVIDDGSTDNSISVLNTYHDLDTRIKIYNRQREPKGAPTCRNIGIKHSKGDYIIFLDSDDYLMPYCLQQRVDMIQANQGVDFLVFPMGEEREGKLVKKNIPIYDNYLIPFLSANLPWSIMCPIWKRSFLVKLHGFSEGYPRFNDPELMIRALLQKGIKFKVFNTYEFDCVIIPSTKVSIQFQKSVYRSLNLFIPDIICHLEKAGKLEFKKYLIFYLHLWFKYICIELKRENFKQTFRLVKLFEKKKIITQLFLFNLQLRLLLYSISKLFFGKPIDKISSKALYLKQLKMNYE